VRLPEEQMPEILYLELIEAGGGLDPMPAIPEPDRGTDFPADYKHVMPIVQARAASSGFRRPFG
jgi:hypothetical protein